MIDYKVVTVAVASQMTAGLEMLRERIEVFPEALWLDGRPNANWRIAYHALYYTDLYLADEQSFTPWEKHRGDVHKLAVEDSGAPYSKQEMLEYCDRIRDAVDVRVRAMRFRGPSGFSWLQMTRMEAHLYNLRHLAHHTGQLADRFRAGTGQSSRWVRRGDDE